MVGTNRKQTKGRNSGLKLVAKIVIGIVVGLCLAGSATLPAKVILDEAAVYGTNDRHKLHHQPPTSSSLRTLRDNNEVATKTSANDEWIVLIELSSGFYDFFQNWFEHVSKIESFRLDIVVVAEDDATYQRLQMEQLAHVVVERSAATLEETHQALTYDTKNYHKLVSGRAAHILQKLKEHKNVLYTDVDTVWRADPLPFIFNDQQEHDMMLQVDTQTYSWVSPYYCTGFMAIRSNERTIQFVSDWKQALETPQLNQPIFNQILHKRSNVLHTPLPSLEFPSGQMYFDQYSQHKRDAAVVVHNNYIAGHGPKKARFVQHGLWKVSDNVVT